MLSKKVVIAVLSLVVVATAIFAFVTNTNVQAQYAPGPETLCGGQVRFQVRLFGDTQAYADNALTQPAVVLVATRPDKIRSKWLICENSINNRAWAIFFVNRILYIPAGSGELVPRQFRDNQP
ncbi:MAG: hypothetical protein CUN49_07705 [Candidatus Thermofonsia Clade 1 bacterium]|jgi:hypothetical protein|uniref:Uncharacterized protein n=1 Tax=Candidatus Thermofonsia Clade 1 bacterium TaxID=2364210 RepID=A0A2M8PEQ6_9CHLR|nr:MAG: hypothetical protein CUN49_07705 [Candidatus Thermofonsia Clade 1 bacterium]RMF53469.1 MAG: hypothetical protein D6749_02235 [Chloroflexota bacterium]